MPRSKCSLFQHCLSRLQLIDAGIQIKPVRGLFLFRFSEDLQEQLERLSEKQRETQWTSDEKVELTGILELDQIFTLLNATIIAESA